MTPDEIKARYDHLLDKVRRLRGYQKEYFKYRASRDLQLAKRFEREVDDMIKTEVEIQKSKQKEFF